MRILMICMGNICRSPTAEAVLRLKLVQAGLADKVLVDSAGTHAYHVGSPPDARAQKHAQLRGYDLSGLRARKINQTDFAAFDLLLVMDGRNLLDLKATCPDLGVYQNKLRCLMEFAPSTSTMGMDVVPDPYYGGPAGFEVVLDLVEAACVGLVEHIRKTLHAQADPMLPGSP